MGAARTAYVSSWTPRGVVSFRRVFAGVQSSRPTSWRRPVRRIAPPLPTTTTIWLQASSGTAAATDTRSASPSTGGRRKGAEELERVLERYVPTVGVEVHVQLATRTKAYCVCSTRLGALPNTQVCPVCLGHPGTLPVLNARVLELTVKAGLAMHCEIAEWTKFDRKNYFYPDTPKNYQISQYDVPVAADGWIELPTRGKRVHIVRAHMEEDSAKMIHPGEVDADVAAATGAKGGASEFGTGALSQSSYSLADHNRAGVPLVEIVSGPDMASGAEAAEFGEELQRILRYAQVSNGNMQDGSLRLDVNVSIAPRAADGAAAELGTKVELKNLNSFSAVERAVDHEIVRQAALLDRGERVRQETRLWDERDQTTRLMRVKEGASDYRYFPEPDIPPVHVSAEQVQEWRTQLPELPAEKRARYVREYQLSEYDARLLSADRRGAEFFERTVQVLQSGGVSTEVAALAKACANWLTGDVAALVKQKRGASSVADTQLTPESLAEMIALIEDGTISGKIGKELVPHLLEHACTSVRALVAERGLTQLSDPAAIADMVREVMRAHPQNVQAYRGGKTKLAGFFVGQVMQVSGGRADPALTNRLVTELLQSESEPHGQ